MSNGLMNQDYMNMTQQFEGWEPNIYQDTQGLNTIGYGFNLTDPRVAGMIDPAIVAGQRSMTETEGGDIFTKLYANAYNDAVNFVGAETFGQLPEIAQAIVTDMSYNLGATKLAKFKKFKKALLNGDWNKAAIEMKDSKWYKQVGNRSKKLIEMMSGIGKEVPGR